MSALRSEKFWLMWVGYLLALGAWYASTNWLPIDAFSRLPGPIEVIQEWLNPDPWYGISIFTETYYTHIMYSVYRATAAFALAVITGVPLGIMMGWSKRFNDFASALFGLLRPIPPLAWVPLAILLFPTSEAAVIYVTFLVAFFATTMNTFVGVRSIDRDYFRAAACLGSKPHHILRHVIIPGALPHIFTGLQIAMGAAWFSLAAGEMIAAQYGLGYMVFESYSLIQFPTIVIGMATLGIAGYLSSALIRSTGNRLMRWREQAMGMEG